MGANFDDFDTQISLEEFEGTVKAADYRFAGIDGAAQYTPIDNAEVASIYRLHESEISDF